MKTKIGIGIITCDRPHFLKKLLLSLKDVEYSALIVVNDGKAIEDLDKNINIVNVEPQRQNVGNAKNIAMQYLLDQNCDYIFTLEDDILIKDKSIFNKYIEASKKTGIQHFNFGFSQRENLDSNFNPVYRKVIDYGNIKIVLTQNILGAVTFYTRKALQTVGLHYFEFNKGHGDHLELTYRAGIHQLTTPFWWFADLYESWKMIENQSNLTTDSVVRKPETFMQNFNEARNIFKKLHGVDIFQIPQKSEIDVVETLKQIKKKYGQ